MLKLLYPSELRRRQAQYKNKEEIRSVFNENKESIEFKNKEFQPVQDYVMKFYGNNRIVALQFPSKEPVHRKHRGKSSIWYKYKNSPDGPTRGRWIGVYLYLPKGQPLDSLQLVR